MKNESYLRYLLTDHLSLRKYYREHKVVSIDDVRRSILLQVRDRMFSIPDHYYRLGLEYSFEDINDISRLFTLGLRKLADEFLDIHAGIVYVKGEKMNDWQLLLPQIPPLLLVAIKIWHENEGVQVDLVKYAYDFLFKSLHYTAIPPAYLPEMFTFQKEQSGFYDLHFHLNGAMESDIVWQDFLRFPEQAYSDISEAFKKGIVQEQFEQLGHEFEAFDLFCLFRIAIGLRYWLCDVVIFQNNDNSCFENIINGQQDMGGSKEHPLVNVFGYKASPLVMEGLMYVKILDYLVSNPGVESVASAFHYYLLILGYCNRLLVQQPEAFGFEQFQKYTSNNMREFSEKQYDTRFFQLAGNDLNNLAHIEGRFSPKDSKEKNLNIIESINAGFQRFSAIQKQTSKGNTSLSLVAHFIKKSDNNSEENFRFKMLRKELEQKANALIAVLNTQGSLANKIVGADAAASEFDTPPEVFAPIFRRLRQCGLKHFTYHAGEDFFHILSGLRAVYEAIEFLDLKEGDRIGHATACGVDVDLWLDNIGGKMWIRMEEYMDDLVFAYYLITHNNEVSLQHLLPLIALRIEEYGAKIYRKQYSVYEYIEAWKKRKDDVLYIDVRDMEVSENPIDVLFLSYHTKEVRNRAAKIIAVETFDIFDREGLIAMQQLLLKIMHKKQIVIETLPTSNVMIGQHHSFYTYQLYNWYKWRKEGVNMPAIVVGSDDAGVFATNIFNEYCHIYCTLVFEHGVSSDEAMEYIERLDHNAKVYAFKK